MRRLLLLALIASAACQEGPVAPFAHSPAATVDPLRLVTICKSVKGDRSGAQGTMTIAVSESAAQAQTVSGQARLGPCPPTLMAPSDQNPIEQQFNPGWCTPNTLGYEVAFAWEPAKDVQGRVDRFEVIAQRAGSTQTIADDTLVGASLLARRCGPLLGADQNGWHWRVRAVDHRGAGGRGATASPSTSDRSPRPRSRCRSRPPAGPSSGTTRARRSSRGRPCRIPRSTR